MKAILIVMFLFVGINLQAAEVCHEIPETIQYSKVSTNFDGSMMFERPRVLVNGEFLRLYENGSNNTSAMGFCEHLDKKYLRSRPATVDSQELVYINEDGSFGDIYKSTSAVTWVVCE